MQQRLALALADRYRIERELGAGGMATVYLAHDLRHQRRVALKVMRPELAAVIGAERFLAEITTTANLQHPHILALFDSGTVDGSVFYVMPFVDGESLRDRLEREKQLPIHDAVRIAAEVADALHYAHQHGIIHRDIKPENILLHGGHALVADFGIALAAARTGGARMTETGMSLGTPTYMSPEQAMGERSLDARTDIYALGCVLYEMLTGDPPHTGSTAQAIVAKVITEKPQPIVAQRERVPAHIEDAVLTALEKLPADRFATAAEFAAALRAPAHGTRRIAARNIATTTSAKRRRLRLPLIIAALVVLAAVSGWLARGMTLQPVRTEPIRFATSFGRLGTDAPYVAISPDGRKILRTETDTSGVGRMIEHDLTTNTITTIAGSEAAEDGEYSPDQQWIAFVAHNSKLKKLPARGGPATTIIDSMTIDDGVAWTRSGDIIFSSRNTGLWRISANGGTPVQLTRLDSTRKDFGHWHPRMLPGERAMIYTAYAARSRVEAYDFETRRQKILVEDALLPRYSPTGHLLYVRDAALYAVAFDPQRLEVTGEAVPVQDDVAWEKTNALAGYDVAPNGTLVFLRGSEWSTERMLVWRDRQGRDTPVLERLGSYAEPRLSPNGRWIALTQTRPKLELFLYDVVRGVLTQLSRAPAAAFNAVWLPDSRRIVYTYEDPVYNLRLLTIDASAPDRALLPTPFDKYATSVASDGVRMLFSEYTQDSRRLVLASLDDATPPEMLTPARSDQRHAVFSPDGRWIAYTEFGDARADVYLRAVDGTGGRRLVSAGGGSQPRWTKNGREIVYIGANAMMSVNVDPATGEVSTPTLLFRVPDIERDRDDRTYSYDVTPDGSRFLVARRVERPDARPLNVVLHWRPEQNAAHSPR